ncbi:MAG: SDR family oxidoreductase [Pseudomonadota bacterium]
MANILIIGASKGIGLATVREGLARGHEVTAFARSASQMKVKHEQLTQLDGNARDPNALKDAVAGHDAVIMTLGVPFDAKMLFGPIDLFSEATKAVVEAMSANQVDRLIAVTGFGAGDSRAAISPLQKLPFNAVFGRAYADKSRQEEIIKATDLRWTLVRPGVLTNGRKTEHYDVATEIRDMKNGIISRADVAHFLIGAAETDAYVGKGPVLSKPFL